MLLHLLVTWESSSFLKLIPVRIMFSVTKETQLKKKKKTQLPYIHNTI